MKGVLLLATCTMCPLCCIYVQNELSDSQKSVVGRVVAEALADDFSTGFRPEDSSHQHQNE